MNLIFIWYDVLIMTNQKLNGFTQIIARMATSATHTFEEKNKLPVTGIFVMIVQTSTFIAALFLTFLAISLTIISAIYSNLKEIHK